MRLWCGTPHSDGVTVSEWGEVGCVDCVTLFYLLRAINPLHYNIAFFQSYNRKNELKLFTVKNNLGRTIYFIFICLFRMDIAH